MNVAAEAPRPAAPVAAREPGLDALRGLTTLLVVWHHTALMYGGPGSWYWRERAPDGSLTSLALSFFCTLNQAWFMGLFFLLAGAFTPGAIVRKGAARFLAGRALRLGLPLLVYGAVIGPATIALARTARGEPFWPTLLGLWRRGVFEPGPLWFVEVLLVLALGAVALVRLWPAAFGADVAEAADAADTAGRGGRPLRPFPSNHRLAGAALAVGVGAFLVRLAWPVGTSWGAWQLGYFLGYLVLFLAGCAAAGPGWLTAVPAAQRRTWQRVMCWSLPVLPAVALLGPRWFGLEGRAEGGWSLPAAVYAVWEPLVAWGLILGLLERARTRWAQPGPPGSWREALARRAFAVYVIHPPVVVGVGLALQAAPWPALLKFLAGATLACLLCLVLAGILLRLPGGRRVW